MNARDYARKSRAEVHHVSSTTLAHAARGTVRQLSDMRLAREWHNSNRGGTAGHLTLINVSTARRYACASLSVLPLSMTPATILRNVCRGFCALARVRARAFGCGCAHVGMCEQLGRDGYSRKDPELDGLKTGRKVTSASNPLSEVSCPLAWNLPAGLRRSPSSPPVS